MNSYFCKCSCFICIQTKQFGRRKQFSYLYLCIFLLHIFYIFEVMKNGFYFMLLLQLTLWYINLYNNDCICLEMEYCSALNKTDNQGKKGWQRNSSNRKRNILLLKYFSEDCRKFSYYFIASGEEIYGLS